VTPRAATEPEVLAWMKTLSNWGRWGEEDQAGTLNLITPERRARAAALVTDGTSVSCSRFLAPRPSPWVGFEFTHRMNASGEGAATVGSGVASDWFGLSFHGYDHTHLDAHSHMFWDGKMYNGRDASLCTTARGALAGGVEPAAGGVIGRGVLVDGPAIRDKPWLESGEGLRPGELDEWFSSRGVEVEPGDALYVRTGRFAAEAAGEPYDQGRDGSPGLAADCLPWLRRRDVAVSVCDVAHDVRPAPYPGMATPIHSVGIVAMGMWLVDNAHLEALAAQCRESGRYAFMSVIVPLALRRATGSPVNPIAVF
jgi:kynurenine formamidase